GHREPAAGRGDQGAREGEGQGEDEGEDQDVQPGGGGEMIRDGRILHPARALGAALALALVATLSGAPADARPASKQRGVEDFSWRWRIPAGRSIEIKGVNGSIHARPTEGDEVEV